MISDVEVEAIVATIITLCATVTLLTWIFTRRSTRPPERGPTLPEDRVTEIERALEAIAIEVERIAEGQRFTAKLLAERIERDARAGNQPAYHDPDGMRRTTPV
jgi:hypothetical protein